MLILHVIKVFFTSIITYIVVDLEDLGSRLFFFSNFKYLPLPVCNIIN